MLGNLSDDERYQVEAFVEALRSEQSIDGLTRQQSRLVTTLRAAPGKIFSRQQLSDLIAEDPLDPPESSAAGVIVCRVRSLRPDLGRHIQTLRGHGYRWLEEPITIGD